MRRNWSNWCRKLSNTFATPIDPVTHPDAAKLIVALVVAGSDFGRQMAAQSDLPLREALCRLLTTDDVPPPNPHRERLAAALHTDLDRRGDPDAELAAQTLLRHPLIQQADHSNLLLDEETFINNWLHHLACRLRGESVMLVSQCSTVACLSARQPIAGPVFLRTRGQIWQIFGHSKRRLKNAHFCLLPPPLRLELPDEGARALCGHPEKRDFADAPEAYRYANAHFWAALDLPGDVRRIATDESMTADLLAMHLEHEGPLRSLFFDPDVRETFLRCKREYVRSRHNLGINRALPDLLWLADGTRMNEVEWGDDGPRWRSGGEPLPIAWTPADVTVALRSGRAYPSRFIAYTIRCLLPGVVALGGSVQQDYVQGYRRILLATDTLRPFLSAAERATIEWSGASRISGRPLLEPDAALAAAIQNLSSYQDIAEFEELLLNRPLGATIGRLSAVGFYWDILQRVNTRT